MDAKKTEAVEMPVAATAAPSETTPDRLVRWLEGGRYKEAIFWLAVAWGAIRGIGSQSGRNTLQSMFNLGEPIAREIGNAWNWLTTNRLVVWTLRAYFGILVALTIAVPVFLLMVHSKAAALLVIAIAATLVAIPAMLVYRAEKNGDAKNQSIPARLAASFNRFVKSISIAVYLSLTAAIFLIYMPAGLAPLSIKILGYAIFVMLAFLAIALNIKWRGGLMFFLLACVLLATGLSVFGEQKLVGWTNELRVNQTLVTIQSTDVIECFNATGGPHMVNNKPFTIPTNSKVVAVFDRTITTVGNCTAVLVYTEGKISGPTTYALLRKGENYTRL